MANQDNETTTGGDFTTFGPNTMVMPEEQRREFNLPPSPPSTPPVQVRFEDTILAGGTDEQGNNADHEDGIHHNAPEEVISVRRRRRSLNTVQSES